MSTVLFVGGGSIGHIAPAIAVLEALRERDRSSQAHFVCSERKEDQKFLKNTDVPFTTLKAPKIGPSLLWTFPSAMRQAKALLDEIKPRVIFSKGGYVSVPICLAAHQRRIPIVLHESDAVMGRANRLVSRWAKHICLGLPLSTDSLSTFHSTGNPIRAEIAHGNRAEGLKLTGLDGKRPILLVTGGSQGAQTINQIIAELLPEILKLCDVVHLTGKGKELNIKQNGYWSRPFVTDELPHLYALADIAVSRAGAGSIAELAANSIPTILVPLRGVGHDHQQLNAELIEKEHGCVLIQQKLLSQKLVPKIEQLISNKEGLRSLGKQLNKFHKKDAAANIAKILQEELA